VQHYVNGFGSVTLYVAEGQFAALFASARAAVGLAEENARLTVSAAKAASLIDDVLRAFGDEYPARMELLEEAAAYLLAAPGSGREGET
jgi:hypothetical protein